ncbi:hypothetical protein K469DRAFT_731660 [Zopfia rhizophila CBS 207.26]|uniref:ferric-chelate reductase (NADPH) n=1 Tax=Zopfia rhizophila CBS 207.26 TaxID=1314779 RepID=A0A6A6DGK8_9PEZI|nr:hypothetical protein K469DRAFT_731660 [Zopfia rhizophila CBS 207.26]
MYHIWLGDMEKEWKTDAWLTILSIGPIRNRYYEIFKATHFLTALFFDYSIATFILYFLPWGFATFKTYAPHGVRPAILEMLPCGFVKIVVDAGITKWKPGQHVFLRFLIPDMHSLVSHPFTICSLIEPNKNEMVFYVKPHQGFTGQLANIAERKRGGPAKVLFEGPYGGLGFPETINGFDEKTVIAGGSRVGFTFPIIEDVLRQNAVDSSEKSSRLHILLATPSNAVAEWYRSTLHARSLKTAFHTGRPDLPKFIKENTSGTPETSVAIVVCQPSSMLHDVM